MKKTQMNKKGITLTSLIIYITIMFVVLAIIMRVTTYYTKNMSDVADTSFEEEFEKFNMYMLQETKKTGNGVWYITDDWVKFTDKNIIKFKAQDENEIGKIYFNDIIICDNVNDCIFTRTDNTKTGKTIININITINNNKKTFDFSMPITLNNSRLPYEFQEVEYIEGTGSQYIDTKTQLTLDTTILSKFKLRSCANGFPTVYGCTDQALGIYLPNSRIAERLIQVLEVIQI